MPISQARVLRNWADDMLQSQQFLEDSCSFILVQEPNVPADTVHAVFYFRWQCERLNEHEEFHEP